MYVSLERLASQGYLLRHKDKTPFCNKGIRYSLAPRAFKVLKAEGITSDALKTFYRNKDVLEPFIDHEVDVLRAYLIIKSDHQNSFEIFCKTELQPYEDYPRPRPDLYLRRDISLKTKPDEYFIELFHDQPLFIAKKRLRKLVHNYDYDWPKPTYPTLMFILADERAVKSFRKYADAYVEDQGMDDEIFILSRTMHDYVNQTDFKL